MASLRRFIRPFTETVFKEKHGVCRLQHMYHAQPYASFNPILESNLCPGQGLRIWPLFTFKISPQHHLYPSPCLFLLGGLSVCIKYTDKKENKIFLIYKEIQNGAVAKSYKTND